MPIINKVPNKRININLQGAIGIPNTDANILLIGHRNGIVSGTAPNYAQLQPKSDYPQLSAYRASDLPSFGSGDAAISYMQSLGFTANYGLSSNLTFPAPNEVITPASNGVAASRAKLKKPLLQYNALTSETAVTLQWDTAPAGFNLLVGSNKQISISQINSSTTSAESATNTSTVTATATVKSVSLSPCQLVLTNVQGTFTSTAQITVSYINGDVNVPDPTRTDEICMMVYSAVNSINTKFPTTINTITPTISICFLNPMDTGFNPSSTPIQYLNSDGSNAVLGAVQTLANGNLGIYFATTPANFGVTPLTALGNTLVSKDSTNNDTPDSGTLSSGTLVQVLPGITSSGVGIELKDVTGTFAVGDAASITLDSTQDVFSLLNSAKQYPVSPYEIKTQADISSSSSKFVPLFNYLNKANAPTSVNNGSFFAMGVVANISIPKQQASTLPIFDVSGDTSSSTGSAADSSVGAQYITGAYYPYITKLGDYPLTSAMVASSYAGIIACNDVPFNPLNNILLKLAVTGDLTTVLNDLSSITTTINLGWTPIAVNSKSQAYIIRAVTGLLYLPDTAVPDTEYFPVTDWQIIGLWKKSVFQALSQPAFTNKRKSTQLKDNIINALQPLALNFETQGMFYNMAKLVSEFEVIDDTQDAAKYDVVTPVCVTPEFNAIDVTVNVVSYLSQNGASSTTAA
ncbi:MAG: hypothetical protein KBD37_01070 [Burkholderiales bacterium]|nr:hypothetical protein [Burkholderiales bacterium]